MLLAIDVGGTKTRLAVYENLAGSTRGPLTPNSLRRVLVDQIESASAASLEEILLRFLQSHHLQNDISAACIGVPGPVVAGTVKVTNLPWFIREQELIAHTRIPKIRLFNDLAVVAAAVPFLAANDVTELHPGASDRERRVYAVLAPGTGLGQGYLFIDPQGGIHPLPSEGGHVEFAPKTELQFALLQFLSRKLKKRVSVERVLCGPGICNIYSFLRDCAYHEEPPELRDEIAAGQAAAVISQHALDNRYEICTHTIDLFVEILGSHAGDTVLTYLSLGGLYLGGGIPPKILPKLQDGRICKAYLDKGRLSPMVAATPLVVIKDDHAALLGAASIAASL